MLETLRKIMDVLIQFFKYKEAKISTDDVKREKVIELEKDVEKKASDKVDEVDIAIENNDLDKINSIIHRIILLFGFMLIFSGCVTEYVPVYVQEDEKVIYEEKDGKPGYWVPQTTMRKLLTYKVKWEAYLEAKQDANQR